MKKWLTMIAGVIMLICISVTVLASDTSETANTVIGVSVYNLNDAEVRAFRNYLENYIGITFNVDFIYSTGILSAEDEIAFIEELHEKGVKGIISFLSTDLEQVLPVCEEYGMLMSAVTCVDNGNGRLGRSYIGSTFFWMTDGTDICIAGNHADGVGNTFTLGCGTACGRRKTKYLTTQIDHSSFKTESCSCTWFIK